MYLFYAREYVQILYVCQNLKQKLISLVELYCVQHTLKNMVGPGYEAIEINYVSRF